MKITAVRLRKLVSPVGNESLLIAVLRDWHWMARRYCDGRMSIAAGTFNEAVRKLLNAGLTFREPLFARDGMGRAYDGLTDAEASAAEEDMPRGHAALEAEWKTRTDALLKEISEAVAEPGGDYLFGLRCGVEDRGITDRYEAAEYGWRQAFEYVASALLTPPTPGARS